VSFLEQGSRVRFIATGEVGTRLPLLGDAHVHLGLTDPTLLVAGGIGRVQELGWVPAVAARWRADAETSARSNDGRFPEILIAGAFLAAPGGYPSDRAWAPAGAVREVVSVLDAAGAVAEQVAVGASVIKITLNAEAGPVFDDATLAAVVHASHGASLRVVAHVEGVGQFARAVAAGVDVLAHTPFNEELSPDLLERAVAQRQQWMSTIDIHGYGNPDAQQTVTRNLALANLRQFVALGGIVVYGTDLGNGKLPIGVNSREVRALCNAGMSPDGVMVAMTAWWGTTLSSGSLRATVSGGTDGTLHAERVTFIPGSEYSRADSVEGVAGDFAGDFADWLAQARVVNVDDLEPDDLEPTDLEPADLEPAEREASELENE
jgi:hypothetical protein